MQNPIIAMADDATRWADEVFEAVRLNKPDDPRHPPIDIKPALKALAGFKPEDAAALAIGATDDADARDAIDAATVACEAYAAAAMSASGPPDLTDARSGLGRAIKTLRRYAATVKASKPIEEPATPTAPDKPAASPEVERAAMLYKQATEADLALRTDEQVYEALVEAADGQAKRDEIAPSLAAFQKQLGRARKAGLLEPKRSPRHQGRATSKSVIRADQK